MFKLDVPFFRPLWRRILTVAVCIGWGFFEFSTANVFFGILFVAAGTGAAYKFWTIDYSKISDDNV